LTIDQHQFFRGDSRIVFHTIVALADDLHLAAMALRYRR
jgi:hypothetical protein